MAYTTIFFAFVVFLVPYVHRIRQVAFEQGLSEIKTNYDKQLLTSQLEIQEETLQVLSQELHDNIAQKIYLSQLYLRLLNPDSINFSQKVEELDGTLMEASDDLHSLLHNLSMDLTRKGDLRNAICDLAKRLEKSLMYKVLYEEEGSYEGLPQQKELFMFRIFQEAINNILRHAMANIIEIRFFCSSYEIKLSIRDNGQGFDVTTAIYGKGLRNMIGRAALINALLVIDCQPGKGTMVDITLPLNTK